MYKNVITEQDYPIEPIWLLKKNLPTLLFSPIFLAATSGMTLLFYQIYIRSGDAKYQSDAYILLFFFSLWFLIIPLVFFIDLLRMKNFHYSLEEKFLNFNQGIISKQNRRLHYGVIQNVIIQRDLLDRIFGLATLSIENASEGGGAGEILSEEPRTTLGFKGNFIVIPGLNYKNAEILKNIILERIKSNPIAERGL